DRGRPGRGRRDRAGRRGRGHHRRPAVEHRRGARHRVTAARRTTRGPPSRHRRRPSVRPGRGPHRSCDLHGRPTPYPGRRPGEGVRMTEEVSPRLPPRDRGAERERTARRRRRGLTIAAAVLVVAALVVGQLAFGLITRVVEVTGWTCGRGWARVGTDELDGPPV